MLSLGSHAMQLSEIRVHPIKSLRGVAVEAARVLPAGLEHDRRWMLVDERGRLVSQHDDVRLALVDVALVDGGYAVTLDGDALHVPASHDGARVSVTVWSAEVQVAVYEPGGAFFSHAEDGWARLRIGSVGFRGVNRCDRCVMRTIDPTTGDKGPSRCARWRATAARTARYGST